MGLKAILDDVASVDEALRGLYAKVEDEKNPLNGKFVLQVEGVGGFALENVGDLKAALSAEREKNAKNDRLLKDFSGLDPADVRKKLERLDKLSKLDPDKEADRLAAEKVEAISKRAQEQIEEATRKAQERESTLLGQVRSLLVVSEAKGALAKHGGDSELLLPHVERRTRVRELEDGSFRVEVLDDRGVARIKDAFGNPMTIEDLVLEMRGSDVFGKAFTASGTSGSGTKSPSNPNPNGATKNPWKKDSFNLTEQMRITKSDPALAKRLATEAGAVA